MNLKVNDIEPINLEWQIEILDSMIKENPDYTVKDYLDLLREVKQINSSPVKPKRKYRTWLQRLGV